MGTPVWLSSLQVTSWTQTRAPKTSEPLPQAAPKSWPGQLGSWEGSPNSACSRLPHHFGPKGSSRIENIGDFINLWLGG